MKTDLGIPIFHCDEDGFLYWNEDETVNLVPTSSDCHLLG